LEKTIGLIAVFVIAVVLAYIIGRHSIRPKGEIVFEPTFDEENLEGIKCTFKLDLDIDQIVQEDYILFSVSKSKRVQELYAKDAESK